MSGDTHPMRPVLEAFVDEKIPGYQIASWGVVMTLVPKDIDSDDDGQVGLLCDTTMTYEGLMSLFRMAQLALAEQVANEEDQ